MILKNTKFVAFLITLVFVSAQFADAQCTGTYFKRVSPKISQINGQILKAEDISGDGIPDLIGYTEDPWNANIRPQVMILIADGSGGFGSPIVFDGPLGWSIADITVGKYDNDNLKDLILRLDRPSTSYRVYRNLGGGNFAAAPNAANNLSELSLREMRDVNGDGNGDLVVISSGAQIYLGSGDGTFQPGPVLGTGFSAISGDFNGDAKVDFVVGSDLVMNNGDGTFTRFPFLLGHGFGENNFLVTDVSGDGKSDVIAIMLNAPAYVSVLISNGANGFQRTNYPALGLNTEDLGVFAGNFTGDTSVDILVNSPGSRKTFLLANQGAGVMTATTYPYGTRAQFAGDFDLDGKTDQIVVSSGNTASRQPRKFFHEISTNILKNVCSPVGQTRIVDFEAAGRTVPAYWDPATGRWIYQSRIFLGGDVQWGSGSFGDVPAPGDFDGDGRTDVAVFRDPTGDWWIKRSSDGGTYSIHFGLSGDKPIPADYDGDGVSDIAVWRPSDGTWYIWFMGTQQFAAFHWGQLDDKPAPEDYDGDGKTDFAVYRPSTGVWYILNSSNNAFSATRFGLATDKIVPGDYDGDGKADIAVYRNADRVLHMLRSFNGNYHARPYGTATMRPFASDFNGDFVSDISGFDPAALVFWVFPPGFSTNYGTATSIPTASLLPVE